MADDDSISMVSRHYEVKFESLKNFDLFGLVQNKINRFLESENKTKLKRQILNQSVSRNVKDEA